jgi:hypothetical protein
MQFFDVFNGDADGLCALHQLRLARPLDAVLITGTKRDVNLLARVPAAAGDAVTVLDVSLAVNRDALLGLLAGGATVEYFDHHFAGEIPVHPNLRAIIDTESEVCTSILVDRHLQGRHREWAIVGAFGDNLTQRAQGLATTMQLQPAQCAALRELGECLNYNAYGDSEADLFIRPAALYERLHRYADPFRFLDADPVLQEIRQGRGRDMELANQLEPEFLSTGGAIYVLPDAPWARRVRGEFANQLATHSPERAHALLTPNLRGGYTVSVRAPVKTMRGADQLCRQFASGGGRGAAAGVNDLREDQLPEFVRAFGRAFGAAPHNDSQHRGA